jgi:hypothetical protein
MREKCKNVANSRRGLATIEAKEGPQVDQDCLKFERINVKTFSVCFGWLINGRLDLLHTETQKRHVLASDPPHKREWPRSQASNPSIARVRKSFGSWISLHKKTNKSAPERREFISIQLRKQDIMINDCLCRNTDANLSPPGPATGASHSEALTAWSILAHKLRET